MLSVLQPDPQLSPAPRRRPPQTPTGLGDWASSGNAVALGPLKVRWERDSEIREVGPGHRPDPTDRLAATRRAPQQGAATWAGSIPPGQRGWGQQSRCERPELSGPVSASSSRVHVRGPTFGYTATQ